jgi:hypothetical protein
MTRVPRVPKSQEAAKPMDHELVFRERNDALKATLKQLFQEADNVTLPVAFYCECPDRNCSVRIELTIPEYEEARRGFEQFIVAPSHDKPAIQQVVEEHESYWVVERIQERLAGTNE